MIVRGLSFAVCLALALTGASARADDAERTKVYGLVPPRAPHAPCHGGGRMGDQMALPSLGLGALGGFPSTGFFAVRAGGPPGAFIANPRDAFFFDALFSQPERVTRAVYFSRALGDFGGESADVDVGEDGAKGSAAIGAVLVDDAFETSDVSTNDASRDFEAFDDFAEQMARADSVMDALVRWRDEEGEGGLQRSSPFRAWIETSAPFEEEAFRPNGVSGEAPRVPYAPRPYGRQGFRVDDDDVPDAPPLARFAVGVVSFALVVLAAVACARLVLFACDCFCRAVFGEEEEEAAWKTKESIDEVSLAAPLLVAYETEEREVTSRDDDDNDGEQLLVVVPAEAGRVRPAQGDRTSCALSRTMDAADARGRTDEHSPLLRETASDEAMKGARAGRDGLNKPRPGLFVLGAVAVCGVFALASGPAWRYGASAHAKLGTWDDVLSASVDAAAAAAANAHWHTSSDVSILGTTTLADDFASENGECSSLTSAARDQNVFTYEVPKQCSMMVVCAGSPRAASTAHCVIAEHVLKNMMVVLKSKDESVKHDQPQYAGYWNYHLHSLCDDGDTCDLYDGIDRTVEEFESKIDTLANLDDDDKKSLTEAMGEVKTSLDQLAETDAESVVVVKTHEFDARLMGACAKRLILTSYRDKEQVFDSGLELGWFTYPKESSRPSFDKVYDMWQNWRKCWTAAVDADPFHTRSHDLSFDALNSEDSFRAEVRRLAEIIMHVMNIPDDAFSVDWIVDQAVKEDFQEELNPTMTNGNLPTEKEKAAENGAAENDVAENAVAENDVAENDVADEATDDTDETTTSPPAAADETTASTPAVNDDFQGELIEEAIEDVVEETAMEVAAEEDAIGEVEATNDAVAEQIEEITQTVETLEATSNAKESVVSSSRVDENAGVDVEPGVVWTRGAEDASASGKGALRAARRSSRKSARKNIFDGDFDSESDMDTAEAEEPEAWVSGASGFDDVEDDAEIAARAF